MVSHVNAEDLSERLSEKIARADPAIFYQLFHPPRETITGPLSNKKISIKSTFDVKGYCTTMGTKLLQNNLARQDAISVERLRKAGAHLVGHTNMTELAYSGLGLNPHYGTAKNPLDNERIPGGSTSGGAVSVAAGIVDIALGTDTGGSLRIPAAFCGLVGFKPSQSSVPRQGCLPLSDSLDSVGPIARSVKDCRLAWQVMSELVLSDHAIEEHPTFVVPTNFGFDGMDADVAHRFDEAVQRLTEAGYVVEKREVSWFEDYKALPIWHFSAVEGSRYYAERFALDSDDLDPRVKSRLAKAEQVSDAEFQHSLQLREQLIEQFTHQFKDKVLLMPTVAINAPKFADLESEQGYNELNLMCLRNTSVANVADACSVSLPMIASNLSSGLMLTMANGCDEHLLNVAEQVEALLSAPFEI